MIFIKICYLKELQVLHDLLKKKKVRKKKNKKKTTKPYRYVPEWKKDKSNLKLKTDMAKELKQNCPQLLLFSTLESRKDLYPYGM